MRMFLFIIKRANDLYYTALYSVMLKAEPDHATDYFVRRLAALGLHAQGILSAFARITTHNTSGASDGPFSKFC